jgi:hypothetical protein
VRIVLFPSPIDEMAGESQLVHQAILQHAVSATLYRAELEYNNCNIINMLQFIVTNSLMKYPASESLSSYGFAVG